MNIKAFTYGTQANKQRDLSYFKFLISKHIPVKITVAGGYTVCGDVNNLDTKSGRIYLGKYPVYDRDNRVIIPVDFIMSVEQALVADIDQNISGQTTIRRGDLEAQGFFHVRSDSAFPDIVRQAYRQKKPIRATLSDGRVFEGMSVGADERSVGIRVLENKTVQVFYDWVDQIVPV